MDSTQHAREQEQAAEAAQANADMNAIIREATGHGPLPAAAQQAAAATPLPTTSFDQGVRGTTPVQSDSMNALIRAEAWGVDATHIPTEYR